MQRPTHQRRANRKSSKWSLPTLALAIVLVAFGSLAFGSTIFATAKNAQLAAAAASASGQCEQKYKQCMSDPKQTDKQKCESDWKKCVAKDTATVDTCPNDSDCEMSCTESATSQKGLLSCCKGGPKHNNSCRKEIDGKCNPAKQAPGKSGLEQLPQPQSQQQMPQLPQANGVEQLPQSNPISPTQNEPTPQPTQNKSWWDSIQQYLGIQPANAPGVGDQGSQSGQPLTDKFQSAVVPSSYQGSQLGQNIAQLQPTENAFNQSITPPPESLPLTNYNNSNTFGDQGSQSGQPLTDKFQSNVVPQSYQGQQTAQPLNNFVNSGNLYQGSQTGQPIGWSAWIYRLLGTFWPR